MSGNWSWSKETEIVSRLGEHMPFLDEVLQESAKLGWEGRDFFGLQMTLEETLTNAIRHGNGCDESKLVHVSCKLSPDRFWLSVEDEGEGFQLESVPDCTAEENLECTGGRGMMLIQAYMSEVSFNEKGNQIMVSTHRGYRPEAFSED